MNESARRSLLISKGWIQAVVIVVLCGFLILGILAYRTYTDEPPIPSQVVDPNGQSSSRERMSLPARKSFSATG